MYMNSAPHLLAEDRPEFERILDEALRTVARASGPGTAGLTSAQLRTMALSASSAISACAAAEYDHYVAVREKDRSARQAERAEEVRRGTRHASAGGGAGDTSSGAGLLAMAGVLTPILAGAAALIFLLVGYLLGALTPPPAAAAPLRTAGWVFAAVALGGILLAMVGLVLTAIRDGSEAIRASDEPEPTDVELARAAWREALRDRGILPFLREAGSRAAAEPEAESGTGRGAGEPQLPHLGYSHPRFSSRGGDETDAGRPRFGKPGFTSPDFTSRPDAGREAEPS